MNDNKSKLIGRITEVVAPDAVHDFDARKPPFSRPPPAELPTVPPPFPVDRRPFPRGSIAGVRVPGLAQPPLPASLACDDDEREPTLTGPVPTLHRGADEPDEWEEKSTVEAVNSAHTLVDVVADKNVALAGKDARIAELERRVAEKPVVIQEAPFDASAYFKKWRDEALKLFIPIVAIAFAGSLAVALFLKFSTDLKIDNTAAKQSAQEAVTDPLPARVAALEAKLEAEHKRNACLFAQIRSMAERVGGHSLTSIPDSTIVHWATDDGTPKPPKVGSIWGRPGYFTVMACPDGAVFPP